MGHSAYPPLLSRSAVLAKCLSNEVAVADDMAERDQLASAVQQELEVLRPGRIDLLKSLKDRAARTGAQRLVKT